MKGLQLKELERIINEEGVVLEEGYYGNKHEAESVALRHLVSCVERKINTILKENGFQDNMFNKKGLRTTTYKNNIYIRSYYDEWYCGEPEGIVVKIKRKKDTTIPSYREAKYKFDHIEIEEYKGYDYKNQKQKDIKTFEEYIENRVERTLYREEQKDNKANEFKKSLEENGL